MRLDPSFRRLYLCALIFTSTCAVLAAQPLVPEMRYVPAGTFLMGTGAGAEWEGPVHRVQVDAFWISSRPVTLQAFLRYRPNHRNPDDQSPGAPVLAVSWDDANGYCRWLSEQTGVPFRLATEAEWERAARGGLDQQRHPWGPDKAQTERRNPFGLYFWPGSPWEWVADWFAESYFETSPEQNPPGPDEGKFRVLRGGGYPDQPDVPAVANRGSARPEMRSNRISFRIVSETEPPQPTDPVQLTNARPERAPKPQATASSPSAASPPPAGGAVLTAVRFEAEPQPVVKLQLTGEARCTGFPLRSPDRYVVDCEGVRWPSGMASEQLSHSLLKGLRWSQFQLEPQVARAVIDLSGPVQATITPVSGGVEVRLQPQ